MTAILRCTAAAFRSRHAAHCPSAPNSPPQVQVVRCTGAAGPAGWGRRATGCGAAGRGVNLGVVAGLRWIWVDLSGTLLLFIGRPSPSHNKFCSSNHWK
ncbi:hypothetical protein [Candidatus Promineifilum breve]|uniref:hypothetical protein n=1 Tax=Candidatus Promineifilum breve TaxID=1806508 RepID=UPI0013905748|nr:hypothetical protein [Candidatus Promineifilum breve]